MKPNANKITQKGVDEIIPYENNPRRNEKAVDKVANSIREFGFQQPIIIDEHNVIICGHTRHKAAKKLGMDKVPWIVANGLTDEEIRAYRLADNKVAEFAEWDDELLFAEIDKIEGIDMDALGFVDISKSDADINDLSDELTPMFEVIVECVDEAEQQRLFYEFQKKGMKCRVLIS